jgi:hypothetical protein
MGNEGGRLSQIISETNIALFEGRIAREPSKKDIVNYYLSCYFGHSAKADSYDSTTTFETFHVILCTSVRNFIKWQRNWFGSIGQ